MTSYVQRVEYYRMICDECPWVGPKRDTFPEARTDLVTHGKDHADRARWLTEREQRRKDKARTAGVEL